MNSTTPEGALARCRRLSMSGLWRLAVGSAGILLLALALNGTLTLGAMRAVITDSMASSVRVVGHDWALRMQDAIRYGKPISQYFGLRSSLLEIAGDLPMASLVALTLPDGRILDAVGAHAEGGLALDLQADVKEAVTARLAADTTGATVQAKSGDDFRHVFPILTREGRPAGALIVTVEKATVEAALKPHLARNLAVLAATALGGTCILAVGLIILAPAQPDRPFSRMRLFCLPIVALAATQGAYSWDSIRTFDTQYREAASQTARLIGHRLERDLERLFDKGVSITRLTGIDKPFARAMAQMPEAGFMSIQDASGATLYRVHRDGRLETRTTAMVFDPSLDTDVDLNRHSADGVTRLGVLRVRLSAEAIAAGDRQRMLDAGTVLLTSALFVVELIILLSVLVRERIVGTAADKGKEVADRESRHVLARPGAFLLVFAWALPLSFVPLRMRDIAEPLFGLPENIVLALPISAEMLGALLTAFAAGAILDRRGWHLPFLGGVAVSVLGGLASTMADSAVAFILARAVVGVGYGSAWMGIQGFIFHWATTDSRARGLSNLVAGIFAGHICGGAVGAILAQQIGFPPVFLASTALITAPGLFALLFMRPYMKPPEHGGRASRSFSFADLHHLLADRNFSWLLLGSVIPFSIAQVGLLYYTLPLYLSEQGVGQSNIGRIMMVYGLSVIYLGPWIGRYVDRFAGKKVFITAGGLIGGSGLAYLYFDHSLGALILSVLLLGLASSLAGAAQSVFALKLPSVRLQGMGKAMGVQRAADKLGQMLGPLMVGTLFTAVGTESGLALTGAYYLCATVAFAVIAREARATEDSAP